MKDKRMVKTSKFLSLVLRHQPQEIGITLDGAGWVSVSDLLSACQAHGFPISPETLDEVVATNDKQRFSFSEDRTRIRANQGHSTGIDLGLEPLIPPPVLYHGTASRFL
ncbi:MAG TPA: RNA 2'-phosphotransferase, partial [Blastocatellia bacterium]|nr:RNA 2'-phosphotransferase [Blastocatellia bacterium]